jgi:UDP-N-acetylmuramoyl-tripeptide--D-alanyl-D-alanine ligase
MKLLTLKALIECIDGEFGGVYHGDDMPLPGISLDSRTLQAGDLYVALKGQNFDGHQFVKEAIQKGASAVLVQRPMGELLGMGQERKKIPQIIVKDTAQVLGEMAKIWRAQFKIPVISVTGSCGKTGTKEMIASILARVGPTLSTKGNLNNHLGMPLMLLNLRESHRFAVIELGASHPGEIRYLVELAQPTVALITNIQASHLEGFGSLTAISKEKSEIYRGLSPDGIAVINLDEPFSSSTDWNDRIDSRHRVTFSLKTKADITARHIAYTSEGVRFELVTPIGSEDCFIPLLGEHVIPNALGAVAASMAVGASLTAVAVGLSSVKPVKGRMVPYHVKKADQNLIVIDDTYNASASAVENALKYLSKVSGKKIFVMSHMAEMGPDSDEYHSKMGHWILNYGIDQCFFTGNKTWLQPTLDILNGTESRNVAKDLTKKALFFNTQAELIAALQPFIHQPENQGGVVLVKGCRSCRMEGIVEALTH